MSVESAHTSGRPASAFDPIEDAEDRNTVHGGEETEKHDVDVVPEMSRFKAICITIACTSAMIIYVRALLFSHP